ncbi:DUF2953 domain-containing protein [Silicimonas sp. MF1-12-2]|uniref:DUF2953 domain-containing protein n=1 Tax=Silicimonas sp. MF1-12-2 TaxID=3384793 RepID=UPI0039B5AA7B
MLVVWAILGVVGLLFLLIVIVVATPMHLRLVAEAGDRFDVEAEVRVLWGLAPRLSLKAERHGHRVAKVLRKPRKRKPVRRHEQQEELDVGDRITAAEVSRLLTALPEAVLIALRRIHLDRLSLRAVFGFDDPADTGQVFGQLTPWIYGVPRERCDVQVRPDFDGKRFEGSAEVAVHLTLLAVAWPLLRLVLLIRGGGE